MVTFHQLGNFTDGSHAVWNMEVENVCRRIVTGLDHDIQAEYRGKRDQEVGMINGKVVGSRASFEF